MSAPGIHSQEVSALFEGMAEKVSRLHCAELVASGISFDVARLRGYQTFEKASALTIGYGFADYQAARVPGLLLPLHDVFGKQSGATFKPTLPRVGAKKKPIKYENLAGSRLMLDVPPICQPDLGNPAIDLWITEGIKKGDALASHGRCAIDLQGVWGWLGTNPDGGKTALADWREVALNDRKVRIVFDSDAAEKPEVKRAESELATYLTARTAKVSIIRIPHASDGGKRGVDDFLVGGGDLDELILAPSSDAPAAGDTSSVARLAALSRFEYEQERTAEAERLGVRVGALDAEVAKQRAMAAETAASAPLATPEPEPWEKLVDGLTLLNEMRSYLSKFIVLDSESLIAVTLWIVFTYMLDIVESSPRLAITSLTKRCGKSGLLTLLAKLILKPLPASNVSAAVLFRIMELEKCALLIDEADTMKAGSERAEEIRGILNSGHSRVAAFVLRNVKVGDDWVPKRFSTWGAIAVAAIGRLPDTWADRSIAIGMKRKSPKTKLDRLIHRNEWAYKTAAELSQQTQRWVNDHKDALAAAEPTLPDSLDDRAMDNWEPLLAVAELAGGEWPDRARQAAVKLSSARDDNDSLCETLIKDIKKVFDARRDAGGEFADRITSVELCARLADMEGPWAEFGRQRKPITVNQLAAQLKRFGIASSSTYFGKDENCKKIEAKGYKLELFNEAFSSYCPLASPIDPVSDRRTVEPPAAVGETDDFQSVESTSFDGSENGTSPYGEDGFDDSTVQNGKIGRVHVVDIDDEGSK